MGEILIKSMQHPSGIHRNTQDEYDNEIQESRYKYFINKLTEGGILENRNKVCYIFGMGKQPRSIYKKKSKEKGLNVVWYGSLFPKILRPLGIVIASCAGLVKVLDKNKLPEVFFDLSKMSMVGVYYFSKKYENEFIEKVKKKKFSVFVDPIPKSDPEYFIYQVDTDSIESSTGIYEIVSYGIKCPAKITNLLNLVR